MPSKAFWTEYFEDAYRDAAKKRREVLDRGLLLIAHLIREELPDATAITVERNVTRLMAVHDAEGTIWRVEDGGTRGKLTGPKISAVRDALRDMLSFTRNMHPLLAVDWKQVTDQPGSFLVALPADPDADQGQDTAPARRPRQHGTPGEDAGNCAQCGRLLIWDGTGKRVNDEWGEYLCSGPRPAGARSAVHILAVPETAPAVTTTGHLFTVDCTTYGPYPASPVPATWGPYDRISVTRSTAECIAEDLNTRDAGCGLTAAWDGDTLVFTWDPSYRNDNGGSETVTPEPDGRYLIGGLWPWMRLDHETAEQPAPNA